MKKSVLFLSFLFLSVGLFAQDLQKKYSVYFPVAGFALNAEAEQILTDLALRLGGNNATHTLQIQAHTDSEGNTAYNQDLAEKRARSVRDFLAAQNIAAEEVTTTAYGETNPTFDNALAEGRRGNRRVDIFLTSTAAHDFAEMRKQLLQDLEQSFTVNPHKSTQIFGKKGTKVFLPPHAFVFADGKISTGEIEVKLTECLDFADMLLADLTTTSGDKILQTGGMLRIQAFSAGEELTVAPDKNLDVAVPTPAFDRDMQLFYGEEHPENDRLEDWQLAANEISAESPLIFGERNFRPAPFLGRRRAVRPEPLRYFPDSTFMPRPPVKPAARRFRPIPFPDTAAVHVKAKKGFFTSKNKIAAERKAKVEKIMTRYEKRLARRAYNEKAYAESLEKYAADLKEYPAKLQEWKAEEDAAAAKYYASENFKKMTEARENFYIKDSIRYTREREEHRLQQKKSAMDFEREYEEKGEISATAMNYYFFQINRAGWINCDKFSNQPRELLAVQETVRSQNSAVYALLPQMNSIIRLHRTPRGRLIGQQLPKGEKVVIFGWQVRAGQPMLAKTESIVGVHKTAILQYRKASLAELKEVLAGI